MKAALRAPRLLWLGRGGCPQCPGSGVTNTHWHKPSVRPSPQPSSCPCYPHLSQGPPLSSRGISEQQEAVPPALGSPAPRREREGAPPPPPPGTGRRVFNGTPQRMAALGSHLVISPAASGRALLMQDLLARHRRLYKLLLAPQARPPPESSYDTLLTKEKAAPSSSSAQQLPREQDSPDSSPLCIPQQVWRRHSITWMCRPRRRAAGSRREQQHTVLRPVTAAQLRAPDTSCRDKGGTSC